MAGVSITNQTRSPLGPRVPFDTAAKAVLPSWDISLALVGSARAKKLNHTLRGKTYVPNVLSYTAGARSGEIVICLAEAKRQAPSYGMSARVFTLYLFIHGLLHLKGRVHGATMERSELKLLARFAKSSFRANSNVPTHRNRHRHRHVPGKAGRGRRTRG